jgi:HD-GYP domain-containing protein (c-di-GMP phosphodiesterase class II)
MKTIKLDYPVSTLDNRLFLPAGEELTSEAMDELIASNKSTSYQSHSFLEYGAVYQDLLSILKKSPYHIVLNKTITLTLMKKVSLIEPVLESLDFFKENDLYTYQHSLSVFAMSVNLARDLLDEPDEWIATLMAGAIHDVGKTCVPLKILKKAEPLIKGERRLLEHHAFAGFVLLSYFLKDRQNFATRVAKEHHERRDGSGYPLGISLRDKMVEIIAVCDIYDALLSPRPFRPTAYDNRTALEEITDMARKGMLSWEVVKALVSHNRKDRPHFREVKVSDEKRGTPPANNLYGVTVERDIKKEIICPNCRGSCKKIEGYEEGEKFTRYECRSCGKEFDEDDLLNIEMEKQ